jgi:hypothetical protein
MPATEMPHAAGRSSPGDSVSLTALAGHQPIEQPRSSLGTEHSGPRQAGLGCNH